MPIDMIVNANVRGMRHKGGMGRLADARKMNAGGRFPFQWADSIKMRKASPRMPKASSMASGMGRRRLHRQDAAATSPRLHRSTQGKLDRLGKEAWTMDMATQGATRA